MLNFKYYICALLNSFNILRSLLLFNLEKKKGAHVFFFAFMYFFMDKLLPINNLFFFFYL